MPTAMLVIAVLGLALGPAAHSLGGAGRYWRVTLDGLSVMLVVGLCLVHLAPHALEHGGFLALVAGVLGVLLPIALSRLGGLLAPIATAVGLALLVLHAVIDGAALAVTGAGGTMVLGLAVIAHRLPVGFAVVTAMRQLPTGLGPVRAAWMVIGLLIVATVGGFLVGGSVLEGAPEWVTGVLEAAVVGVLLHTVLEPGPDRVGEDPAVRIWSVIGGLLGLIVLLLIPTLVALSGLGGDSPFHHLMETNEAFFGLVLAASPALLLGYASIGLLRLVPTHWQLWRGLPPVLPLEAAAMSVPLLGWPVALARVALVGTFFAVHRFVLHRGLDVMPEPLAPTEIPPLSEQLRGAARAAFVESVDRSAPWLLLGLWIAALSEPIIGHGAFSWLPEPFHVPVMTLIGLAVPGGAAGMTAIGAIAMHQGLTAGSVLALVFAAPAARVASLGKLDLGKSRLSAMRIGMTIVLLALVGGWGLDLLDVVGPEVLHQQRNPLADALQWLCVVGVAALALASLVRRGPRGLIGAIVAPRHAEPRA